MTRWMLPVLGLALIAACNGDKGSETATGDPTPDPEVTPDTDTDLPPAPCDSVEFEGLVGPTYLAAQNWNQWVRAAQTSQVCESTGESCDDCWHGGEHRTAVIITTCTCEDVRVSDALGVLDWSCTEPGGGRLELNTSGFRANKGLSDLIDAEALAWRDNSLVIAFNDSEARSEPAAWWNNAVAEATGSLDQTGTIYVANSDPGTPLTLAADGVALVVADGVTLAGDGSDAVVQAQGVDRVWFEGTVDAGSADYGVDIADGVLSVLNRSTITGGAVAGARLSNADSTRVAAVSAVDAYNGIVVSESDGSCVRGGIVERSTDAGIVVQDSTDVRVALLSVVDAGGAGLSISGGDRVRARAVSVVNPTDAGVRIDGTTDPELSNLRVTGATTGVEVLASTTRPVIADMMVLGSSADGISVAADDAVLMQITAVGNEGTGVDLTGTNAVLSSVVAAGNAKGLSLEAEGYTAVNVAAVGNSGWGVDLDATGRMSGALVVGDNSSGDCRDAGGGTLTGSCGNAGASDASVSTGAEVSGSFLGPIGVDDGANPSDTDGAAAYEDIEAWSLFASDYRAWMRAGAFPPPDGRRSRCEAGDNCVIIEAALHEDDTVLLNRSTLPTGDEAITHTWSADEDGCADIPGGTWAAGACTGTFLPAAVETLDDAFGNDNGLCESFDSCYFMRNLGAYQGHGRIRGAGAFTDGTIEGVTLRRFANNGKPTP